MIGIDTNCLLRYALRDDVAQHRAIEARIAKAIEAGDEILINDIVLSEFVWVLESSYDFTRPMLIEAVRGLLDGQQFVFEHKDRIQAALRDFASSRADFADCFIGARNARLGCDTTLTFDRAAQKLETFHAV